MARPEADINLLELEKLSVLQCTDEEIASFFSVSTKTIERRKKDPEFRAVMERGKAKGRISVRRAQMKLLEAGNATMGIWLGKQLLGQANEIRHEVNSNAPLVAIVMPRRDSAPNAAEIVGDSATDEAT